MWCEKCEIETTNKYCEICNEKTVEDVPVSIYWCSNCHTPIIKLDSEPNKNICNLCKNETHYLSRDLRPVFPEERLLLEIILNKPLGFIENSVWAYRNRYYIDGKAIAMSNDTYRYADTNKIKSQLEKYSDKNNYKQFNSDIKRFIKANRNRLNFLETEAMNFIKEESKEYPQENIVISFSGGKDSTAVADLVIRSLKDPSIVHIFGDTTLEFPSTMEYSKRYRENNMKAIFMVARNNDQNFMDVCKDIGPPARMLRWCCYMFKTGPISRVINTLYPGSDILTFYGIRKSESASRSKYNRVEDNPDAVKINKQKVAGPIFHWFDIDVWLYILTNDVDFNDAYRLGYDRVGCWCCPNNNIRAQFLSRIYMTEQSNLWRDFLIDFSKSIGKLDAEEYVDSGNWKARQGGNGLKAADDVKINYVGCTSEDNSKIYQLNKKISEQFYNLFIPFGLISKDLGRKLLDETLILDINTLMPIISIQPFGDDMYDYSVKIKVIDTENIEELERQIGYQIRKYNACRSCLKCESLCKFEAIKIIDGEYYIDKNKCKRCKMCVTAKYIEGGCLMDKYLKTK